MKPYVGSRWVQFGVVLAWLSLAAVGSWIIAALVNESTDYWYLLWNLFLAWLPFIFGLLLVASSQRYGWRSKWSILLAVLWLGFLPNTFYLLTDYIHLQEYIRGHVMLDIVMFTMFVFTGLALGFSSVLMIHQAARQKIHRRRWVVAGLLIGFFLCAFAMYLGRELRWNTWDLITNPFGIIFSVSDLLVHPYAHPDAFQQTLVYFGFLTVSYYAIWRTSRIVRG